jgi:SAM-dependent methyltransferase
MAGIMKLEGALILYHAGIETGLFTLLEKPSTLEEIAREANITKTRLLSSLLDLGLSLNEISCKKGKYRLKGSMARALATNLPLAELVRETVRYHADVAQNLGAYLTKNTQGDYLNTFGGVIAESSRILEPFIKAFIYGTVKKITPLTILEFGCGSGEYLKYYADIHKSNGGIAIDLDPSAVAIARKKIRDNGIEGSFTVMQDNIMNPATLKDATFDLVTSFSNMHYFSSEDRARLFGAIHARVKTGGRFILATGFKTNNLSSAYYDLIFSATQGLYGLPRIDEVVRDLKEAGFGRVKTYKLFGGGFMGIVAFK